MPQYKYLIVGGGMTADAAVRGIRKADTNGSIGLISAESDPPYDRPPLSKGLWKGKKVESIFRKTDTQGATLHLGLTAVDIDSANRRVLDDQGESYGYERLLLATGGSPRHLPFGENINYFRTLEDYRRLREDSESGGRVAVIGGGFIGSEVAAALALNQKEVTILFPEQGIGARIFPQDLSAALNEFYRLKGVSVMPETMVVGIEQRSGSFELKTRNEVGGNEQFVSARAVVAGLGIEPNVGLASGAGLEVDNGIVVNEYLQTSNPDIFAAGDCAHFLNPALGKRIRVEHEDNAKTMGRTAGQNMAGEMIRYEHLPMFYSDLFELGYEAVGDLDSRLETVSDWKEPFREGVVYYLQEGRVRGVLLWNVWNQVDAARRLISDPGPFKPSDLVHRLPENGE